MDTVDTRNATVSEDGEKNHRDSAGTSADL